MSKVRPSVLPRGVLRLSLVIIVVAGCRVRGVPEPPSGQDPTDPDAPSPRFEPPPDLRGEIFRPSPGGEVEEPHEHHHHHHGQHDPDLGEPSGHGNVDDAGEDLHEDPHEGHQQAPREDAER